MVKKKREWSSDLSKVKVGDYVADSRIGWCKVSEFNPDDFLCVWVEETGNWYTIDGRTGRDNSLPLLFIEPPQYLLDVIGPKPVNDEDSVKEKVKESDCPKDDDLVFDDNLDDDEDEDERDRTLLYDGQIHLYDAMDFWKEVYLKVMLANPMDARKQADDAFEGYSRRVEVAMKHEKEEQSND